MTFRTLAHGSLLTLLMFPLALAAAGTAASSCGQNVATCNTICSFSDAPGTCGNTCSGQQACATANGGADFQAYLTCVANAGQYAVSGSGGLCAGEAATVAVDCGSTPLGSGSGTSSNTSSSGCLDPEGCTSSVTPPDAPACAVVADCCPELPPQSVASCNQVADDNDEIACENALGSLAAAGYCTGGESSEGDDSGDDSLGDDSSSDGECGVGEACFGPDCELSGAGPCGSDVILSCGPDGVYSVSSFPCGNEGGGCGVGGDCSESCMCTNGQMVCTGDCPDGGLSDP